MSTSIPLQADDVGANALDRIERAIMQLLRRVQKAYLRGAGPYGPLDRATYAVLGRLHEGGPMRLTDLAACVHLDPSTLSRQVSVAERAGLVIREPDQLDGRARRLRVTDQGKEALAAARAAHRLALQHVLASWSAADANTFADLLERFGEGLDELRASSQAGNRTDRVPEGSS